MICVERVHRIMMALMIVISIGLLHMGYFYISTYLLLFISIMILIWAITDFCPSIFVLRKFLPNCRFGANK